MLMYKCEVCKKPFDIPEHGMIHRVTTWDQGLGNDGRYSGKSNVRNFDVCDTCFDEIIVKNFGVDVLKEG